MVANGNRDLVCGHLILDCCFPKDRSVPRRASAWSNCLIQQGAFILATEAVLWEWMNAVANDQRVFCKLRGIGSPSGLTAPAGPTLGDHPKPANGDHLKGSSALLVEVRESAESAGVGKEARVGAREGIRRGRTSAF
jgi:hypothetical protein